MTQQQLAFERTLVQFPALTWQLRLVSNSTSRGPNAASYPLQHASTQRSQTRIHVSIEVVHMRLIQEECPLGKLFRPSFTTSLSPVQVRSEWAIPSGKHR